MSINIKIFKIFKIKIVNCSCLYSYCDGEHDFIALEDLRPDGYAAASRQDGLDLNHSLILMKALGRFHALSLALKHQEPDVFKGLLNYIEVNKSVSNV